MPAKKIDGDESIGAFVERRFGKECVVSLAQPMIGGIYGANIYNLSLNSTFPNLAEMENKNGGVIRGVNEET
jgi:oxygen-dependent protoporphyrinogen oxidase